MKLPASGMERRIMVPKPPAVADPRAAQVGDVLVDFEVGTTVVGIGIEPGATAATDPHGRHRVVADVGAAQIGSVIAEGLAPAREVEIPIECHAIAGARAATPPSAV